MRTCGGTSLVDLYQGGEMAFKLCLSLVVGDVVGLKGRSGKRKKLD